MNHEPIRYTLYAARYFPEIRFTSDEKVRHLSNIFDKSNFFCKTNPISPKIQRSYTLVKQRLMKTNPHFGAKNPKPNFQNTKMTVSYCFTMNYEQITMNCEAKNKANSKPIQTQFKPKSSPASFRFSLLLAPAIIWQCRIGPYKSS